MSSSKIKDNHNQDKLKKIKETAKRHSNEDQGSSSEKKNIKCKIRNIKTFSKNNLTESNQYNKVYQMYKKIHILDLLNRFKDAVGAMRRLNISWNELSEAEVNHLESMMEEN